MTNSLIGASASSASSQSTVFVTVGNSGVVFGHSTSVGVGQSSARVNGKSVNGIFRDSSSLQIILDHGGSPLSQNAFRAVRLVDSNGIRLFATDALGSTGFFLPNVGGSFSNWTWKGTGIDSLPWGAADVGQARVVAFLR